MLLVIRSYMSYSPPMTNFDIRLGGYGDMAEAILMSATGR